MSNTKTINEVTYKVAPFMALDALKLQNTIVRLIGPAVARVFGGVIGAGPVTSLLNAKIDAGVLSGAVQDLFLQLDDNTFMDLLKRILRNTTAQLPAKDGKAPKMVAFADADDATYNVVFAGHPNDMYKVMFFVLEVNYPDFFGKIREVIGNLSETVTLTGQMQNTQED